MNDQASNQSSFSIATPIKAIADWCRTHLGTSELSAIGGDELQRMASDLNLQPGELMEIASHKDADPSLMLKMMELHGLDEADIRKHMSGVIRDMEITCSRCGDRRLCAHDMAIGADTDTLDQYCPNAETMKALARG